MKLVNGVLELSYIKMSNQHLCCILTPSVILLPNLLKLLILQLIIKRIWKISPKFFTRFLLLKTYPFCQAATPSSQFELLNLIYVPSHPRKYLYADLYGPFPTGEYIFTVIDAYSRYPEAVLLKDTSSESLIKGILLVVEWAVWGG